MDAAGGWGGGDGAGGQELVDEGLGAVAGCGGEEGVAGVGGEGGGVVAEEVAEVEGWGDGFRDGWGARGG